MNKKREQGNVLEIVIIAIMAIVIVGLLVWRFMDSRKADTTTADDQTTSQSQSTQPQTEVNTNQNATSSFTREYCLPIEKLCVKIDPSYTVNYSTVKSEWGNGVTEKAVFRDNSGHSVATLSVYAIDGLGGGCDAPPIVRIASVDTTSVAVYDTDEYSTKTVNVVAAALPENNSSNTPYRALVFLSSSVSYSVSKDIKGCSNTFYANIVGARNNSVIDSGGHTLVSKITFEYGDNVSYKTIDEAAKQLNSNPYVTAKNLLKTVYYQ